MKKNRIVLALACSVLASTFVSCIEENFTPVAPAQKGDDIVFGARAGFENGNLETRTEYSGVTYTSGGKTFERINWIDGADMVEIYCAEALNAKTAHYAIEHKTNADNYKDYAYLAKIEGQKAMQWGEGEHTFYAMYPSTEMLNENSTLKRGIRIDPNDKKLYGYIPTAQTPVSVADSVINGKTVAWAAPDMTYAYMAAKTVGNPEDGAMSLTFMPIVTAVQIELVAQIDTKITEIVVSAPNISGPFTADLASWNGAADGTYPLCTNGENMEGTVMVSMWQKNGEENVPYELKAGHSLVFTVFLNPSADISNLKVGYDGGAGALQKELTGAVIKAKCKTRITQLKLDDGKVEVDYSKWMSQLNQSTTMKELSIPGTGGSFSYGSNQSAYYKSQTLTFDQQWARGIRVFEIVTSKKKSSFANEILTCNKQEVQEDGQSLTVSTVVTRLLNKLAEQDYQNETAMVIFTYQSTGWGDKQDSDAYMENAMGYFSTLPSDRLVLYQPELTMADAKGKLMIVVRPTQRDQNNRGTWENVLSKLTGKTNADKILVIDGCGTAKDKWGARGYKINGEKALDISNEYAEGNNYMEYYMQQGAFIHPNETSTPVSYLGPQFGYTTNQSNITCWFQEWARVVGADVTYTSNRNTTYWFESYSEKLSNVVDAFTKAINDKTYSQVYINSLCGYLAGSDFNESITPSTGNTWGGSGGDIKALADKLNHDFYQYVINSGFDQATGPTGVVLMDYVSDTETDGGAYYLPGVIVNNNFKHNAGSGAGSDNTGGNNGGGSDAGGSDEEEDVFG